MDQQHKKPAANTVASSHASSGSGSSSSSRSMHGSMSSAFLGVSSSTHSQRRSSPSLYPPTAPAPLPDHLASGGSASASGSSSSQFNQNSPSSAAAPYRRRPRPSIQRTHSLPSPFLSELSSIRRMGTNVFGDLNAQEMTRRRLLHGQQEQEMTRSSSSLTMPHCHYHTPIPSGEFSFPSTSHQQQAQPSFSSLQPLLGGNFSGFPLPASQPQQMQPSSSTDLPSRIFSGFEPPAASQHFSTYLMPLPSRTTVFQSSPSCSAQHAQPSSDSELPPLPPSLEIRQCGLPSLGHLSQNNGSSTEASSSTGFVQPSSNSEMYELAPLPPSLQIPPPLLQQVKQETVVVAPSLVPEIISLDDDGDELSALVHSFASSHNHGSASLPTNIEDRHRLQLGGSAVDVGGHTWEAMPAPASEHDKVNNGGGSSNRIPGNCHGSMPLCSQWQQQAIQQLSDLLSVWSSTVSMGSSVAGTCQGWAGMPALANKLDIMSIGGSSCSGAGPEMCWNYNNSSSVQSSNPVPAVPKLILGGMDRPGLPPRPPALGAGASSSSMSRMGEHFFSEDDMETIRKDNRLRELMKTDPKRVKRIIRNRVHVARLKVRKEKYLQDLQCRADALKMECISLSKQVQSHKEMIVNLKTVDREMQIKLKGLNEQVKLSQVLNQHLQSEVQRLKHLELNMMCANGIHNPTKSSQMAGWSASSSANGLHQQMHSHANDLISSHQLQAQEHATRLQLEEQPNQAVDDELMVNSSSRESFDNISF